MADPLYAAPDNTACSPSLTLAEAEMILKLIDDDFRLRHQIGLRAAAVRIESAIVEAIDTSPYCVEAVAMSR